jgi:hypothetical protein
MGRAARAFSLNRNTTNQTTNMNNDTPPPLTPRTDIRFKLQPIEGPASLLAVLDSLLKNPGRIFYEIQSGRTGRIAGSLLMLMLLCLPGYGLVVGSLTGGAQFWIAPAKIVIGSAVTAVICLPSLYIFLCLGGIDTHLRRLAGELAAAVALTAVLLIGFAPVAWVFSQSTDSIALMASLHLAFWAVAVTFGLRLLRKSTGAGGTRSTNLGVWMVIYVVVSLQMMTSLRPIIGRADTFLQAEKQFFTAHWLNVMTK